MSKVFKTLGTISGIAATVAVFAGNPVLAAAFSINSVLMNTAAALTAKPPAARGQANGIVIGANQPSPYLMGTSYSEGILLHDVGYGGRVDKVDNPYRFMAVVYSCCGPVQSLEGVYTDFSATSFSGNAASGYYSGFLYRDYQLGAAPESDALTGPWGTPTGWSASHKLSAHAAIGWSLKFDKKGKKYANGVPRLGAIWKGVKVYDPRADSTYPGGDGSQRIDDETTWAWSDNPALHALAYGYGRYRGGIKVFGVDLGITGIDLASFVAWANVCDTNGWKVGGTIYEPGDKWNNLKLICQAGGAEPVLRGGVLSVRFHAPKTSLDTITAADLADGESQVPGTRRWKDKANGVLPKYRSAAHQHEYVPSDLVTDSGYVSEDGEDKIVEVQFDLVQDKDQAAQLAAYQLVRGREIGPIVLPLKPRLTGYRPGDALTIDIPEKGLSEQLCEVTARSTDPASGAVQLTFMTVSDGDEFALGQTGTAPPTPSLSSAEDRDSTVKINLAQVPDLFDADSEYELGDVVLLPDRSTWLYINASASTGNVPATGSSYWLQVTAALTAPDIGVEEGATRNTKEFNDDLNYADTAGFLERWAVLAPNGEGNIAMEADSAAPGGRALAFSAPDTGGGDEITSGTVSSSSLNSNTSGNSVAALTDGVFDAGASALGTDKETDPWIIRDLGSVQSVGNIKFAPISTAVEGPLDGPFLPGILTATSNYGNFSPALPNDGSHLRDNTFSGYSSYHACDVDGSAPTITFTLTDEEYCSVIRIGPVNSGDPQAWSPTWLDGTAVKTKPNAGSFTTRGTAASSANDTLQSFDVDAEIGVVTLSRTTGYMAVSELHVLGRMRFGVGALDGIKVRISSLASPDPVDDADWSDVATISGTAEGALTTLAVDDDCRHIQFFGDGADLAIGLSELEVYQPVVGGSSEDSLEFEANTRILIEPGALYVATFTVKGDGATANNFEAGISCFNAAGDRTRLNIAADQDDVTTDYTVFKGYFRASTGSAVEPASDPTDPCLMPSGTVEIAARFLCDTGNEDFILAGSVSIDKIDDSTAEAGADQTSSNVPRHEGPASTSFTADYTGALDGGQLARNLVYRRIKGASDVSASATWSIVSQSGITGGTVTVSGGGITIPDGVTIAANGAKIVVRSARDGVTIDSEIAVNRNDAVPPGSGGGGTGTVDSVSSFASISTNSFVSITGTRTVHTGSGGEIDFAMSLTISGEPAFPPGEYEVELKFRYRPVSGSFSDVDSATYSDPNLLITNESGFYYVEEYGAVALYQTKSGLTADTDYEWEILARRTSASLTKTLAITGSASATGS